MVLIFSAHANHSRQIHREIQRAFDKEKPVVPFRIENVAAEKALAFYMGPVHWLDALTPPVEEHLQKLAASVRALVRAPNSDADVQEDRMPNEARSGRRRVADRETEQGTEGRIKIEAKIIHGAVDGWCRPGAGEAEWFQDHEFGPEMVVVPAGVK
jgi:hypothetical protein